jgi:putative Mg2+ transporter-C (MgtC) family protein
MFEVPEEILQVGASILVGGMIGLEREFRDKSAGFRTLIFICVGATLFTILSNKLGGADDPVRIAANVVTGIGFLGAGAIIRHGTKTVGLTTAATIWLTAALGMGIGGGHYMIAVSGAIGVLIVLWFFPYLERLIDRSRESHFYEVVCVGGVRKFDELETMIKSSGLKIRDHKKMKSGERSTFHFKLQGRPAAHDKVMDSLFADTDVESFSF